MFGRISLKSKRVSFVAGIALALVSLVGFGMVSADKAFAAQDCDENALIYCGFTAHDGLTAPADFINKVRANSSHAGGSPNHKDLQAIFSTPEFGGLDSSEYDRFIKTAKHGYAYRNGDIKVDGISEPVATNAVSIGRSKAYHEGGTRYFSRSIKGTSTTVYGNTLERSFASGTTRIPVWVMFDANGVVEFIVMDSCGNVTWGDKVTPSYSCKMLNAVPDTTKANTYKFSSVALAAKNASIAKVVYDFGDGSKPWEEKNPATVVSHTYAVPGEYTAKVTVYVNLPGGNSKTIVAVGDCVKIIRIASYECIVLDDVFLDTNKLRRQFTATARVAGGAKLISADFDFGDGSSKNGVAATGNTATVEHAYDKASFTDANNHQLSAKAVLHFTTADGKSVTANTCSAVVPYTELSKPECKPHVPVGSPECLPPCTPGSSVPPESAECKPPELPKTGAGNTIAIFAAVVIGGFLVYRQLLFRKHRSVFVAAEQGTSLLPLADPLNDQNPLAGTPLEHKKPSSFRRKRMF